MFSILDKESSKYTEGREMRKLPVNPIGMAAWGKELLVEELELGEGQPRKHTGKKPHVCNRENWIRAEKWEIAWGVTKERGRIGEKGHSGSWKAIWKNPVIFPCNPLIGNRNSLTFNQHHIRFGNSKRPNLPILVPPKCFPSSLIFQYHFFFSSTPHTPQAYINQLNLTTPRIK